MFFTKKRRDDVVDESYYLASQWQLMWRKFKKHQLAHVSLVILSILYLSAIFAEFVAPQGLESYNSKYTNCPPQRLHFFDKDGFHLRPFVYGLKSERHPETNRKIFVEDTTQKSPIRFLVAGERYKLWGLFPMKIHLFGIEADLKFTSKTLTQLRKEGLPREIRSMLRALKDREYTSQEAFLDDVQSIIGQPVLKEYKSQLVKHLEKEGTLFLLGSDKMGRDLFSRIIHGSRISLSVGFLGVVISLILGVTIGGISGYFGGWLDNLIQRFIEIVRSFPTIPLWMAMSAALPPNMPPLQVYFFITVILSLIGWTGLARKVRSKFISLREEDFVMAAKIAGCTDSRIIRAHLVPGFLSYLIVDMTLAIPRMVLAETSLSFLGLGIRAPMTSWGVLLQEAQQVQNVALYPWVLIPVFAVIITVLAFNFLGDGLRDAADPYK